MITLAIDTARLAGRVGAMRSKARNAASAEIDSLIGELEARIAEKLNGGVLQSRSGALASSISANESSLKASLAVSADVKYAAIQEYGGTTPAHDIVATKGKALAFVTGGGTVYAKIVHHPGSRIPSRSYMRASLDEMKDSISAGLKTAVVAGLQ